MSWLPTPPVPSAAQRRAQITYETLLASMGVRVGEEGRLYREPPSSQPTQQQTQTSPQQPAPIPPWQVQPTNASPNTNTNPYFQPPAPPGTAPSGVRRPRTLREYRDMLLADHLRKQQARRVKSTKLLMYR